MIKSIIKYGFTLFLLISSMFNFDFSPVHSYIDDTEKSVINEVEINNPILTGPIVFHVDASTVEIMTEFTNPGNVSCTIVNRDDPTDIKTVEKEIFFSNNYIGRKKIETTWKFTNLQQNSTYDVFFPDDFNRKNAKFRVFGDKGPQSIITISCNDQIDYGEIDYPILDYLSENTQSDPPDLVLHTGDQVYGDKIYFESIDMVKHNLRCIFTEGCDKSISNDPKDDHIREEEFQRFINVMRLYTIHKAVGGSDLEFMNLNNNDVKFIDEFLKIRDNISEKWNKMYRDIWNEPNMKKVFLNSQHIMILDDHEVKDDTPSNTLFLENIEQYITSIGYDAAIGFQNYKFSQSYNMGSTYLLPTDTRSASLRFKPPCVSECEEEIKKSEESLQDCFERKECDTFLGEIQLSEINSKLDQIENNSNIKRLILITPIPIGFLSKGITNVISSFENDLAGHWSMPTYGHNENQIKILDRIFDLKENKEDFDVIIIGGDMHIGGVTEISRGNTVIKQITSSSLRGNYMSSIIYNLIIKPGLWLSKTIGSDENKDKIILNHYDWVRGHNFARLNITEDENIVDLFWKEIDNSNTISSKRFYF